MFHATFGEGLLGLSPFLAPLLDRTWNPYCETYDFASDKTRND